MSLIKAQLVHAVEQMDDDTVVSVWDMLSRYFNTPSNNITWESIVESAPDDIDLEMIAEMDADANKGQYISRDELLAKRNARKLRSHENVARA